MIKKLLVTAVLSLASMSASATTLVDGGFEAKGAALPVTNYCYDGLATPGGPACAASPWVGGGVIISGSGPWGGVAAPEGGYYGFVQIDQTVSQSFTATANAKGSINWVDRNRPGNLAQNYKVTLSNGVWTYTLGNYSGDLFTFAPRTSADFWLVSGDTYTVAFKGLTTYDGTGATDRTVFIDNVALTTMAVPEPATWAMLVVGFGLVGLARRRSNAVVAA
ncbi:PEPxxWA-CTERM sorting domain-containing protein [Sandarakinorhabdus sp.]|uniref:PEPxxWA-CTERM sorting domain-containing protein n=1 Tax=Sandarakinorhabdus sp. TaxID=1916663 RepID=UPI0033425BAD